MATAKALAEQMKNMEEEIRQKQNQLKELKNKYNTQEDKERTQRRIDFGKILENLIEGAETLTYEQIRTFLIKTIQTDFARKILNQIREPNAAETNVKQSTPQDENGEDTGEKSEAKSETED